MSVVVANVASTTLAIVVIVNAAPNQLGNAPHGQVLQLLKYIKSGRGWGKGVGSESSKKQELERVM
jgi:hypothetical protein